MKEGEEDAYCSKSYAHHPAYQAERVGEGHDLPLEDDEVLVHCELDGEEWQDCLRIHHPWL